MDREKVISLLQKMLSMIALNNTLIIASLLLGFFTLLLLDQMIFMSFAAVLFLLFVLALTSYLSLYDIAKKLKELRDDERRPSR